MDKLDKSLDDIVKERRKNKQQKPKPKPGAKAQKPKAGDVVKKQPGGKITKPALKKKPGIAARLGPKVNVDVKRASQAVASAVKSNNGPKKAGGKAPVVKKGKAARAAPYSVATSKVGIGFGQGTASKAGQPLEAAGNAFYRWFNAFSRPPGPAMAQLLDYRPPCRPRLMRSLSFHSNANCSLDIRAPLLEPARKRRFLRGWVLRKMVPRSRRPLLPRNLPHPRPTCGSPSPMITHGLRSAHLLQNLRSHGAVVSSRM